MELTRAGGHFRTTDEDTVVLWRRLAAHYDDTTIAVILSRQGRRTATGLDFTKTRVASLRVTKGITAYHAPPPTAPRRAAPRGLQGHDLSLVARRLHHR